MSLSGLSQEWLGFSNILYSVPDPKSQESNFSDSGKRITKNDQAKTWMLTSLNAYLFRLQKICGKLYFEIVT